MTDPNLVLPDFDRPPVIETVLSVQFDPIRGLEVAHFGLLWNKFRAEYPLTEQHPPLEPVRESFRRTKPPPFEIKTSLPIPRVWFLNKEGTELIQVQSDRFVHNWRKRSSDHIYPRYDPIRSQFEDELLTFSEFLHKEELGPMVPNQCEVTYVNHIVPENVWKTHGELEKVLSVWSGEYSDDFLGDPETIQINVKYLIRGSDGKGIGRLHISLEPRFLTQDDSPIFVLNLTARGRPDDDSIGGVLRFLDRGRQEIVRGFTSITTQHMHRAWGKT